jgi:hypothetical protein
MLVCANVDVQYWCAIFEYNQTLFRWQEREALAVSTGKLLSYCAPCCCARRLHTAVWINSKWYSLRSQGDVKRAPGSGEIRQQRCHSRTKGMYCVLLELVVLIQSSDFEVWFSRLPSFWHLRIAGIVANTTRSKTRAASSDELETPVSEWVIGCRCTFSRPRPISQRLEHWFSVRTVSRCFKILFDPHARTLVILLVFSCFF